MDKTKYVAMARGGGRRKVERVALELGGVRIEPVACHKWLGVEVDQELRFKQQCASAVKKGTTWLNGFRRLAKTAKSVPARYMRRFYQSVAMPKMFY